MAPEREQRGSLAGTSSMGDRGSPTTPRQTESPASLRSRYRKDSSGSPGSPPTPLAEKSETPQSMRPPMRLPSLSESSAGQSRVMSFANNLRRSLGFVPPEPPELVGAGDMHNFDHTNLTNTKIASSLLLQQCLFYNWYWSPCWMFANLLSYGLKEHKREDELTWIFGSIWLLFEPLRMYCGFEGNLQEKVPFLAVFMLITTFPHLAVNGYLGYAQKDIQPFDSALATVSLLFLVFELVVSGIAIRQLIRSQDEKFSLEDYERPMLTHANTLHSNDYEDGARP